MLRDDRRERRVREFRGETAAVVAPVAAKDGDDVDVTRARRGERRIDVGHGRAGFIERARFVVAVMARVFTG